MKKTKISLIVLTAFFACFNAHASAPNNSLDCTDEEVLQYASKDNYDQPAGVSVMPSTREFEPAHITKERTETPDDDDEDGGGDSDEVSCLPDIGSLPTLPGLPDIPGLPDGANAWERAKQMYDNLSDAVKNAADAFGSLGGGESMLKSAMDEAMERIKEAINKPICERMGDAIAEGASSAAAAGSPIFKEVMWDELDERYDIDEDAYNDGNKTVMHELIKNQNKKSGSELQGLFEQMGAKDEGEELTDFLASSGLEASDIQDALGDDASDYADGEIDDALGDIFGDYDNPFADDLEDAIDDENPF